MSLSKRLKTDQTVIDELKLIKKGDQCLPLFSLEELRNWKPPMRNHDTAFLVERESIAGQPKTLVCHDMKGGYLDDRHIHGKDTENNYYFLHWTAIDIFVYFSHHLVTIPPCGWISAAHKNGVKILGTFITEWDDGIKVCEALLENEDAVNQLSSQLSKIATHFNFDGWLINIENKLQPCQIPLLRKFVEMLTQKMHASYGGSLVIWYDSVLETGDLKWQNALNENNRLFFDCCDGIFLNYNWTEETLQKSVEMAGERKADVFVGADVFGRGCPGGGGFCTNIAIAAARKFDLSSAIFAPGWVSECLDIKDFKENQFKFWDGLKEFCPPRKYKSLPLYSSFCPGFGKKLFKKGNVINNYPWFNLSLQQPQPIYFSDCCPKDASTTLCTEDSFQGGGCLCLVLNEERQKSSSVFKIIDTSFSINESLFISYTFKPSSPDLKVHLSLNLNNDGRKHEVNLCHEKECSDDLFPTSASDLSRYGISENPASIEGWIKRVYIFQPTAFSGHVIEDISIKVSAPLKEKHMVLLGELEILPISPEKINFHYRDLMYNRNENDTTTVWCTLLWSYHPSIFFSDLFLIAAGEKVHLCRTSQFYYNLEIFFKTGVPELELLLSVESRGNVPFLDVSLKIPVESGLSL